MSTPSEGGVIHKVKESVGHLIHHDKKGEEPQHHGMSHVVTGDTSDDADAGGKKAELLSGEEAVAHTQKLESIVPPQNFGNTK